jgi:hypothetical protein
MRDAERMRRTRRGHAASAARFAPAADYAMYDDDPDELDAIYDDEFEDGDFDDRGSSRRDSFASLADELIDDLVPPQVDWRRIVSRHPWPALLVAGLGGYLLGRSQGKTLLRAVSALAVARVEAEVLDRIESDADE